MGDMDQELIKFGEWLLLKGYRVGIFANVENLKTEYYEFNSISPQHRRYKTMDEIVKIYLDEHKD